MGILKYIPKRKEIIDNRSSEGGFYEAECDECNNIFFPKRSNAKYCSRSCLVMAYRKNKTAENSKKQKVTAKPLRSISIEQAKMVHETSGRNMAGYLRNRHRLESDNKSIQLLNEELQTMGINTQRQYGSVIINRRSVYKFQLFIKP